jgi:hypothetical protein
MHPNKLEEKRVRTDDFLFTSFFNCMLVHYFIICMLSLSLSQLSNRNQPSIWRDVCIGSFIPVCNRPQLTSLNLHDYKGQQLWPLDCVAVFHWKHHSRMQLAVAYTVRSKKISVVAPGGPCSSLRSINRDTERTPFPPRMTFCNYNTVSSVIWIPHGCVFIIRSFQNQKLIFMHD